MGKRKVVTMITGFFIVVLAFMSATVGREQGFVYCPAYPCLCEPKGGELLINCRYLYLTELPKFLSFDGRIKELSMRKNSIRFLPDNSFRGLSINTIDLSDNIVTRVDDGAFNGLEHVLEELHIQVYAMEGLPTKALAGLNRLQTLSIIGCRVPRLERNTFAKLTQLKELHLISCRINDIEAGGIGILRNLQVLDLSGNNLKYRHLREISKLYGLRKLALSNNNIGVLGSNAFDHLLHLRKIDLSGNSIVSIDRNAFKTLDYSLELLNLEDNQIKDKAMYSLKSLRNLRELNLAKNNLTKIVEGIFTKLVLLSELDLGNNKIVQIKTKSFQGTGKYLRTLKLSNNPLRDIENRAFARHSALKQLYLDNVGMSKKFKLFSLVGLENSLEELSIQNSSISEIDLKTLKNLTSLKILTLKSNNLKTIPAHTFQHLISLEKLDISHNGLSHIADDTFEGLQRSLQSINLQHNNISTLSKCTFDGFNRLGDIRLGQNPLNCDCRLGWLHNWVKMHHIEIQKSINDWKCAAPAKYAKKGFRHLSLSQLTCPELSHHKNKTCDWATEGWTRPIVAIATEVVPSPMLPVDLLGTDVYLELDGSVSKVISSAWNCTSKHSVGGYRVVVRRTNDSFEERDVVVTVEKSHFIFSDLLPGFEYEVCLTVLSDEEIPLGRECQVEITQRETKTLGRSRNSKTPFLTLLWTYVAGSLAATLLFVTVAICIRRHRQKKLLSGFAPGYSAWAGMMYGLPSSQPASSCYFNSTSTGYDDVDITEASDCCPSRCSAVSTFRRNMPANYIVTAADLNDDFYFHF